MAIVPNAEHVSAVHHQLTIGKAADPLRVRQDRPELVPLSSDHVTVAQAKRDRPPTFRFEMRCSDSVASISQRGDSCYGHSN